MPRIRRGNLRVSARHGSQKLGRAMRFGHRQFPRHLTQGFSGYDVNRVYLKCSARGLTGDQRNSVYVNGEKVTVNLDEGTMHSWTFGTNLAVHVTDTHLFFETALTLGNIWQNLFDPTAVC